MRDSDYGGTAIFLFITTLVCFFGGMTLIGLVIEDNTRYKKNFMAYCQTHNSYADCKVYLDEGVWPK